MYESESLRRGGCRQAKEIKIPYSIFQNVFGVCKRSLNARIHYLSLESNIHKLAIAKKNGPKS